MLEDSSNESSFNHPQDSKQLQRGWSTRPVLKLAQPQRMKRSGKRNL